MEYLRVTERPSLRNAVAIAAFAGWNDASEVATFAARYLVQRWSARKTAELDPEEFYVFTDTRPHVRITGRFQRRIEWPANEFYYHIDRKGTRDYLIIVGVEPQLKWRTFAETVVAFCREVGVSTLVTLGGLVADVPHTMPVRLSGTSSQPQTSQHLRRLGVEPTRYEGPTGIVGVLNNICAQHGITAASIWGTVPDYLSATPNVKVTLAILDRLASFLGLDLELADLRTLESQFDRQVSEALAENPEVQAYVQELEERERSGRKSSDVEPRSGPETLPSSEALIHELEDFLRRRRGQSGSQPP